MAAYTSGIEIIRGHRVEYEIGEIVKSQDSFAERWKWSRTKVKTFFKLLEKERMIYIRQTPVIQVVGVANFENYQNKNRQKSDSLINKGIIKENKINTKELLKIYN